MDGNEIWAFLIGILVVGGTLRSIFVHWRSTPQGVPLQGWYQAAENWLQGNGYQVLRRGQKANWSGYVDATEYKEALVADFIVRKAGSSYAVQVGKWDSESSSGTELRTKWFPVCSAFRVDGVIFIDVDGEAIHNVDFEVASPSYVVWKQIMNRMMWLMSGVLMTFAWLHGR